MRTIGRVPRYRQLVLSSNGDAIAYFAEDFTNLSGNWTMHTLLLADGTDETTPFSLGGPTTVSIGNGVTMTTAYGADHISPNLKWCLVHKGDSPLYARELPTGKPSQLTSGPANVLAWTADSKAIVVDTTDGHNYHYYRVQVER